MDRSAAVGATARPSDDRCNRPTPCGIFPGGDEATEIRRGAENRRNGMSTIITRKRVLILATLGLLVVPLALEARAQGPRGGGMHGQRRGFMMGRLMRGLELSEDQRAGIHSILEAQHEASASLREQLEVKHRAVFEASRENPIDENAIRAAVFDAAALQAELAVSRARVRSEVWQQLTPEQQAKAEEM